VKSFVRLITPIAFGLILLTAAKRAQILASYSVALVSLSFTEIISDNLSSNSAISVSSLCWLFLNLGMISGKICAAFLLTPDGSGVVQLMGVSYAASASVLLITLIFFGRLITFSSAIPTSPPPSSLRFRDILRPFLTSRILKPIACIFLSTIIIPDVNKVMSVWKAENSNIGADMQVVIELCGDLLSMVGMIFYSRFLATTSYRRIFVCTQFGMALVYLCDLVLVKSWHSKVITSDLVFVFSYTLMRSLFLTLYGIGYVQLAAQLTPRRILNAADGKMFYALMLSVANFAGSCSLGFGSFLIEMVPITDILLARVILGGLAMFLVALVPEFVMEMDANELKKQQNPPL